MSEIGTESGGMGYDDYLKIPKLLDLQNPLSCSSGEMLFIILHQSMELWLKLIICELREARNRIMMGRSGLGDARKHLARVKIVLSHLVNAWDIISTLSPKDYAEFRNFLGSASGLQSHQFVLFELILSRNDHAITRATSYVMSTNPYIQRELDRKCLYDELLILICTLYEDWIPDGEQGLHTRACNILHNLYSSPDRFIVHLYEVCEDLVDIEDTLCQWHHRHIGAVLRLIGLSSGTGGTAGVAYLEPLRDIRMFKELWSARQMH
jgi:tryptophan 2,3-dioxygenase